MTATESYKTHWIFQLELVAPERKWIKLEGPLYEVVASNWYEQYIFVKEARVGRLTNKLTAYYFRRIELVHNWNLIPLDFQMILAQKDDDFKCLFNLTRRNHENYI